jgi:hypothetical protein
VHIPKQIHLAVHFPASVRLTGVFWAAAAVAWRGCERRNVSGEAHEAGVGLVTLSGGLVTVRSKGRLK